MPFVALCGWARVSDRRNVKIPAVNFWACSLQMCVCVISSLNQHLQNDAVGFTCVPNQQTNTPKKPMNTKHAQQKTLYIPVIRLPFWFSVSFFFVSGKKSFVLLRFKKFLLHYFIFFFYVFFLCFQNVIRNSAGFLHVALS